MEIINQTSSRVQNPDGSYTMTTCAAPVYYQDDQAAWKPVVYGSLDKLPGNCEMVPVVGGSGYRLWKPNGKPPYNPAWLPTDYWLEVVDLDDVAECTARRATINEDTVLTRADSPRPRWKWTWNSNLTHRVAADGSHVWVDSVTNAVIFTKANPAAWSQADVVMRDVRKGRATVDADGNVTIDIDLTGLKYPVIFD